MPTLETGRLRVEATDADGRAITRTADMLLVVVGVRPDTELAAGAGAVLGFKNAIAVAGRCAPTCRTCSPPGTA